MHPTSDESLFAAFQQHGDVEALATIFRRRADELLRLAVFLAPRPSEAEDLVQATFLSAIARAETYRASHRVMSWLCGILTNHARMLRRAERRGTPDLGPGEIARDPVSAALQSELRQALAQSITQLAEPYRSVLRLHLNDGLNSQEISQRLDRPPATVRKQMGRAIQQLRTALPLGLATALLVKMSPAQIAERAAEAAQFVDVVPVGIAPVDATATNGTPLDAVTTKSAAPQVSASLASWLGVTALALLATMMLWPATTVEAEAAGSPTDMAPPGDSQASTITATAIKNEPAPSNTTTYSADREAVAHHTLSLTAQDPDGKPHAHIEVLCVLDDGRAPTTRLLAGTVARCTTDVFGHADITGLAPGRYQLSIAGALPKTGVHIVDRDLSHTLTLPKERHYSGSVTDAFGRPIAGAAVLVTETSGRGDLAHKIAITDATGQYHGSCLMWFGRIFARHPDHGQSACRRLQPGRELRLELAAKPEIVTVQTCDADGRPLPHCFVALVPKSQDTHFYVPHLTITDADGRCSLPGPGPRHATLIAQCSGWAPTSVELPAKDLPTEERTPIAAAGDEQIVRIRLGVATTVSGVALDHEGKALSNREVVISVAGNRTNEPSGPMLALRVRTDARGRFSCQQAPRARLQVRIYSDGNNCIGPPMSQFVVVGADIDTRTQPRTDVRLIAAETTSISGTVRASDGSALADYHVIAVPELGSATHRMFRRRTARTDALGRFVLPAVAKDESYQLGFYPPDRWWPNQLTWPIAIAPANATEPCTITIDEHAEPASSLTCQVLRPNGEPSRQAIFELRHLTFQAPMTCPADASGRAQFTGLSKGDYWLVVRAPGLGSRTMPVHIDNHNQHLDLGTTQLPRPARVTVRLLHTAHGRIDGLRLVGKSTLGDKFVSATSQTNGVARLRPLPPGPSTLLVHGPGIAPRVITQKLSPGRQWLDLEVQPANAVTLRFPFVLADNPFVLNGPLHVRVFDQNDKLVLEDYVGATNVRGRFDLATGLLPGRYRVRARSLWNALAEGMLDVPTDGRSVTLEIPLRL